MLKLRCLGTIIFKIIPWEVVSMLKNGFGHRCLYAVGTTLIFLGEPFFGALSLRYRAVMCIDFGFLAQNPRRP